MFNFNTFSGGSSAPPSPKKELRSDSQSGAQYSQSRITPSQFQPIYYNSQMVNQKLLQKVKAKIYWIEVENEKYRWDESIIFSWKHFDWRPRFKNGKNYLEAVFNQEKEKYLLCTYKHQTFSELRSLDKLPAWALRRYFKVKTKDCSIVLVRNNNGNVFIPKAINEDLLTQLFKVPVILTTQTELRYF